MKASACLGGPAVAASRWTVASTLAACSPPITLIRLLGQVNRKRGRIGAAAHAVIARAEAAADQDGDLRHARRGDGGDELGAMLRDAFRLILPAHHEARNVLQEQQRDSALAGKFDEMRALLRAFTEQHAIVGEDGDGQAVDGGEAADQRRAVQRLELVELAAVDQARDHLVDVVRRADVVGDHAVEVVRRARAGSAPGRFAGRSVRAASRRCRATIDSAWSSFSATWSTTPERRPCVSAPPKILGADDLSGRGLHQRRAGEEDRPLPADDDRSRRTWRGHRRRPRCSCP